MKAAASVTDFVVAPVGTFLARRTFILCAPSAERMVVVHLASLDHSELATVNELLALPNTPGLAPRYDILYDVGAVESMDRATFNIFEAFVRMTIDHVASRSRRFALVRPEGLPGHMFSGMFHDWLVPRLGEHVRMFEARDAVTAWLEFPDGERAEIETTIALFTRTTPLVREMREALARNLRVSSLGVVAAKLGTSARSLQRHLAEIGTTFRDELGSARIHAAQVLLVDTDDKIESIAVELGFKSFASFTTSFRAAIGETPARYRESRRSQKR